MKPINEKFFNKPIILSKFLDSGNLLVVDSNMKVVVMDNTTLDIKSGFNIKIAHTDYNNLIVDFTSNGSHFATLSSDAKDSRLFDIKSKKTVAKVSRHQGKVSCVGIDPKNSYMFSCGEDGKTFAIDIKSGQLVFALPAHVDSVNDIAFSSNADWVATASYDKKVSLFSLDRKSPSHKLIGHSAPVMKLQFLSRQRLFSVDKDSNGIVWDIQKGKVLKRLDGLHDVVTQVTIGSDNKFLFLGTKLGYIFVYDTETYEQISQKYIKLNSSITSLSFNEEKNHLIVATEDSNFFLYNIYDAQESLKKFAKAKKYGHIQAHIERNPLLKYTKIYERVENLWNLTLKKATLALKDNNKNRAIALFKSFKDSPDKNKIMREVINEYAEFDKFTLLAKEGKIALAYSLLKQYPAYQESNIYKSLEVNWKKSFVLAQKYLIDSKFYDKALELLAPYKAIPEKAKLIQELLSQSQVHKRFKIILGQKDFKAIFELIKLHPFLKEFSEYEVIMNYADTLYIKAQKFIEDKDTNSAIKILKILIDFPDYKEDVKAIIAQVEAK